MSIGYDADSDLDNSLLQGHEITPGSPIEGGNQSDIQEKRFTPTQDHFLVDEADQAQAAGQPRSQRPHRRHQHRISSLKGFFDKFKDGV